MSLPLSRRAALAALALAAASGTAWAQQWPTRPVKLIVPFPAGGSTDVVGRLLAEKLAPRLGQPVVIENRGGAGGTSGSDLAAKSPADGYTFLLGTSSTHAIAPSVYPKLPYDPVKDFTPVSLVGTATILMVVHPSVLAKSVGDFIALAKSRPGGLMYGSTGNGSVSHLTAEYFKSMAGIDMKHVPYKGDAPLTLDLVAGRVQVAFGTAVAFLPQVKSGKLKALAVTDAKPSPVAPQLPTVASSGLPGFEALQWFGLFAPAHTPTPVVQRMNAEVEKVLHEPEVQAKLKSMGMQVAGGSPAQFASFQQAEAAKWGRIARESGAKVD